MNKIKDKIIEFILSKLFLTISGLSIFTVIAYVKGFLFYPFTVKVWYLIIFALLCLSGNMIIYKMKSKRKFIEGSKVDLISGNLSAMTTGKYKFFTNKVECSWFDIKSGEIKLKYLNENTLKEHVNAPQQNYIAKPSNHY